MSHIPFFFKIQMKKILSFAPITLILVLATWLRLWNLSATEFKYDEATVSNLAAQWVDTGTLPLRGMGSSVGIDNPPLTVYVMALPVLFSRDPLVLSGFVALLNVAGVWGCWALGRRYWSERVGLLAALWLATSPWAIFYSRKVWAQDILLPFVLLFFFLLLSWWVQGRPWRLSGAVLTLAALTQIHFATVAFVPILALLVIIRLIQSPGRASLRRMGRDLLWPLAAGGGLALLLYAPYLCADAATGWRSIRAMWQLAQQPAHIQWQTLHFALINVGGREIHALAGSEKFQTFLSSIIQLNYWPDRLEEGWVVLGLIGVLARWLYVSLGRCRRVGQAADGILLLWLLAPLLFYLRSKSEVFPHYLIPLYPANFLVGAVCIDRIANRLIATNKQSVKWQWVWSGGRALGWLCLAALAIWQSYLSLSIHAFVDRHDTPGGLGTPVRIYRQAMGVIERYTGAWQNRQVVVLCDGDEPRWAECPAVWTFLLSRRWDVRLADQNKTLLFPSVAQDTLIVLSPGANGVQEMLSRYADELVDEQIALRESSGVYRFYRLPAGTNPTPIQERNRIRLENGVLLRGYDGPEQPGPGQSTIWWLYWQIDAVPSDPPPQGYSFSVNLLGADGQRWGQQDGPGQRVGLWRHGDVLISRFDLPLAAAAPPGPYRLRVGMYVYTPPDQFVSICLLDAADRPVGDAVEWKVSAP